MSLAFWVGHYGDAPKWVKKTLGPPVNKWNDLRYWYRRNFVKKYRHHVVYTGLDKGWHDVDDVMEAAIIALVRRYVEWELDAWCYFDEPIGGYEKLKKIVAEERTEREESFEGENQLLDEWDTFYENVLRIYEWFVFQKPDLEKQSADHWDAYVRHNRGIPLAKPEPVDMGEIMGKEPTGQMVYELNEWPHAQGNRDEYHRLNKEIDKTTQELLELAVRIRGGMWT